MRLTRGNARLADIQAQQVEVGRIRLGTSTPKVSRAGRAYNEPVKLDRFRLTSRSRQLIEHAAELYGGEPGEWTPQNSSGVQWEVIIERDWLGVIVPANACSQYYEQWAGGRCQVRCDGTWELMTDEPCVCGPDPTARKCKPYTRLSLMLAEMPGVGIWRLETHGYNAAAELPAVADLLSAAGGNVPARLEMEQRSAEVPDPKKPDKTVITTFMVPVLHVEATPAQLISVFQRPALEAATRDEELPALPASPAEPASVEPPREFTPTDEVARDLLVRTLRNQYSRQIAKASDAAALSKIRDAIRQDAPKLDEETLVALRVTWNARQQFLANAGPASAPAIPAAPAPAAQPALDRKAVWMEVNTLAGFKNITLSRLKALYGESGGEGDLTQATAEQLVVFRDWLKNQQ